MSVSAREGLDHVYGDVGTPVIGVGQDGKNKIFPLSTFDPDEFTISEVNVPGLDATDAVITLPARGVDMVNVISGIAFSYDDTPAPGNLIIEDGSDTVFNIDVTVGGPHIIPFVPPRKGKSNREMTITLAGVASMAGKVNVLGSWVEYSPATGSFEFNDSDQSGLIMLFF